MMPLEIELKLAVPNPPATERRLLELGAARQAVLFETNVFFDFPDARLQTTDQGLRVRIEERVGKLGPPITRLTYKGPRQAGQLKTRQEVEVLVDDADATESLLNALGLARVLVFEKLRRLWQLDDCQVTLDTLPGTPQAPGPRHYLEIEGPSEAAVRAAQAKLGLAQQPIIPQTYLELLTAQQPPRDRPQVFAFEPQQRDALRASAAARDARPWP